MEGVSFYTISFEGIKAEFMCKQIFISIFHNYSDMFYEFPSANSSPFLMIFDRTLRIIKLYSKTGL